MATSQSTPPSEYGDALKKHGFELHELIDQGAAGSVFRATQVRLKRTVAVKFFDGRSTRNPANRRRFEREHLLLAKLEHPSIPYILTAGVFPFKSEKIHYIVMQFIHGTKLSTIIEQQGRMDAVSAIGLLQPVLSALACVHRENIVHRDVAPDNIIITPQATHLIDFSIGVCTDYEPGLTRLTEQGEKIGRLYYASPEQKQDSSSVDLRTDIYSAGIVLFELLAGHPQIRIDRINQDLAHVSPELRDVIKKACASSRNERFSSADSFADILRRLTGATLAAVGVPTISLCPNTACGQANWSHYGYFRGPRIEDECDTPRCDGCGSLYIKNCPKCHASLSSSLRKLVTKHQKSNHDSARQPIEAHCTACGELIFRTPTCEQCGSLLKRDDMTQDTLKSGCTKCRRQAARQSSSNERPNDDDDTIPF